MVYTYTPTYYSTIHDSITSICKTILPFSFKKRRGLPASDNKLAKLQSDNLKWQQDSFHQILNLMGLHREGILGETEVSAFRSHLLDTLIASPPEHEHKVILRDKLVFLQELLYAKCITEEEYHSSKRPLLQRLAVQGAEIEARDVVVGELKDPKENSEEEWSVIDLRDEKCLADKENLNSKNKSKHNSAIKQIKGAASVFGFSSSHKLGKNREEKSIFETIDSKFSSTENPFWDTHLKERESETKSILMTESTPMEIAKENGSTDRAKRKPFKTLFHREQIERHDDGGGGGSGTRNDERAPKSARKQWGFEGFKKWKKNNSEDETAPLPLNCERSDGDAYTDSCNLVSSPVGEGPDTKQIKRKLLSDGSPSDFFIDKVVGDKIKKELSRIQTELNTTNHNLKFSDDQIEAISTKLPVDKADLTKFFPKSWCDHYGEVVLDVVKKEFKDHVGEMEVMRNASREKHSSNSMRWTTFDDDNENSHPNIFSKKDGHSFPGKQEGFTPFKVNANAGQRSNGTMHFDTNPFTQEQNPFWNTNGGYDFS